MQKCFFLHFYFILTLLSSNFVSDKLILAPDPISLITLFACPQNHFWNREKNLVIYHRSIVHRWPGPPKCKQSVIFGFIRGTSFNFVNMFISFGKLRETKWKRLHWGLCQNPVLEVQPLSARRRLEMNRITSHILTKN